MTTVWRPMTASRAGDLPTPVTAALVAGLVGALLLTPGEIRAEEPLDEALSILKAMSHYVASEQNIKLTFDSAIEVITPELEKIQFTSSGNALVSRPDKIRAHRVGGFSDVELYFDGAVASINGKSINGYSQIQAEGTLDDLIHALRAGHGVALPAADLLLSNSYEVLAAEVLESKYLGRGVVAGVECEHLAFRNFDTDWQIWVAVGDEPAPRKLVITSKTLNSAPQYSVIITSWKTGIEPGAEAFAFTPPEGATLLPPDGLIDLDELPQEHRLGGGE